MACETYLSSSRGTLVIAKSATAAAFGITNTTTTKTTRRHTAARWAYTPTCTYDLTVLRTGRRRSHGRAHSVLPRQTEQRPPPRTYQAPAHGAAASQAYQPLMSAQVAPQAPPPAATWTKPGLAALLAAIPGLRLQSRFASTKWGDISPTVGPPLKEQRGPLTHCKVHNQPSRNVSPTYAMGKSNSARVSRSARRGWTPDATKRRFHRRRETHDEVGALSARLARVEQERRTPTGTPSGPPTPAGGIFAPRPGGRLLGPFASNASMQLPSRMHHGRQSTSRSRRSSRAQVSSAAISSSRAHGPPYGAGHRSRRTARRVFETSRMPNGEDKRGTGGRERDAAEMIVAFSPRMPAGNHSGSDICVFLCGHAH